MENAYIAALLTVAGIGQERVRSLMRFFAGARQAWLADRRALLLSGCLPENVVDQLIDKRKQIHPDALLETWQQSGISVVSQNESHYPALLRTIYHPPELLFYRGTLPMHDQLIAIVGTRKATSYGKNAAKHIAASIAATGVWVVSGAARGIDTAAHLGALEAGETIAVLGCGVDISYPPENSGLLNRIAASGAVISEYPPGTMPARGLFPARNRIISGLSRGVVIIEAGEKSGALITADAALEQNRDVFAVPGSIFSSKNHGAHCLIKQGAKLIDCAADILEEYQIQYHVKQEFPQLTPEQAIVYDVLTADRPLTIEEIVMHTNLTTATVSYILLQFELQGIAHADGQWYVRSAWEGNR